MKLKITLKAIVLSIVTLPLFVSCSKKIIPGFYVLNKSLVNDNTADPMIDENLELNRDGTFTYTSFGSQYNGGDVANDNYCFLGKGKYRVVNKVVILKFDKNFKIDPKEKLKINPRNSNIFYKVENQGMIGDLNLSISLKKDSVLIGYLFKLR